MQTSRLGAGGGEVVSPSFPLLRAVPTMASQKEEKRGVGCRGKPSTGRAGSDPGRYRTCAGFPSPGRDRIWRDPPPPPRVGPPPLPHGFMEKLGSSFFCAQPALIIMMVIISPRGLFWEAPLVSQTYPGWPDPQLASDGPGLASPPGAWPRGRAVQADSQARPWGRFLSVGGEGGGLPGVRWGRARFLPAPPPPGSPPAARLDGPRELGPPPSHMAELRSLAHMAAR